MLVHFFQQLRRSLHVIGVDGDVVQPSKDTFFLSLGQNSSLNHAAKPLAGSLIL